MICIETTKRKSKMRNTKQPTQQQNFQLNNKECYNAWLNVILFTACAFSLYIRCSIADFLLLLQLYQTRDEDRKKEREKYDKSSLRQPMKIDCKRSRSQPTEFCRLQRRKNAADSIDNEFRSDCCLIASLAAANL